jgi:hypothetical protein
MLLACPISRRFKVHRAMRMFAYETPLRWGCLHTKHLPINMTTTFAWVFMEGQRIISKCGGTLIDPTQLVWFVVFQEHTQELRVFHIKIERGFKCKKLQWSSNHRWSSSKTFTETHALLLANSHNSTQFRSFPLSKLHSNFPTDFHRQGSKPIKDSTISFQPQKCICTIKFYLYSTTNLWDDISYDNLLHALNWFTPIAGSMALYIHRRTRVPQHIGHFRDKNCY